MEADNTGNWVVYGETHAQGLQSAHAALQKCLLCSLPWSSDDFYSAMAIYRKVVGIEFDDDAMLDKWLDGADAAWRDEVKSKGDRISLAEALEKAIDAGMKAIGVRLMTNTSRKLRTNRGNRNTGVGPGLEAETSLKFFASGPEAGSR